MDKKIIFSLLGNMLVAFSAIFFLPIIYSVIEVKLQQAIFFLVLGMFTAVTGSFFGRLGKNHKRKLKVTESAATLILTYPVLAIFATIPFLVSGWLSPVDAFLETISDLTSTGLSILPQNAPYIFRLWQSVLMWFGSLIFLIWLVTLMPEVGGCFGLELSLHGGQIFSPMFGQMFLMSKKICKVYAILTAISFLLFKLAGLNFWDSVLMSMRCISTGGGDFFAGRGNIFVEYAAAFTMLMACGNFLFFYRLINTLPPAERKADRNIFYRAADYLKRLKQNIFNNAQDFFTNSEVKAVGVIIFFSVAIIFFSNFAHDYFVDSNIAFRHALFHIISFLSTSGMSLASIDEMHDFDRFLIFMTAFVGGCMGSVTGGLKIMRVLVLQKTLSAELKKVMHPHMVTNIRVNKISVPSNIVGRILSFFFLASLTVFVCATVLSFIGTTFSEGVAMSVTCLTTVGNLPGICEPQNFLELSSAGKIFCMLILMIGRIEIFALLILLASVKNFYKPKSKW